MVDMGVEPFLVASTVESVMAQRLVRRLCPSCKEAYKPLKRDLPADFPWAKLDGKKLHRPRGCRECRDFGYRGRLGVYELLITTERVQNLAQERASSWELKKAALEEGMLTLRDDGWDKVIAGNTSIEEVQRISKAERLG